MSARKPKNPATGKANEESDASNGDIHRDSLEAKRIVARLAKQSGKRKEAAIVLVDLALVTVATLTERVDALPKVFEPLMRKQNGWPVRWPGYNAARDQLAHWLKDHGFASQALVRLADGTRHPDLSGGASGVAVGLLQDLEFERRLARAAQAGGIPLAAEARKLTALGEFNQETLPAWEEAVWRWVIDQTRGKPEEHEPYCVLSTSHGKDKSSPSDLRSAIRKRLNEALRRLAPSPPARESRR